jgi:hypothetical protein
LAQPTRGSRDHWPGVVQHERASGLEHAQHFAYDPISVGTSTGVMQHQTRDDDVERLVVEWHRPRIDILYVDPIGNRFEVRISPCDFGSLGAGFGLPKVNARRVASREVLGNFDEKETVAASHVEDPFIATPGHAAQHATAHALSQLPTGDQPQRCAECAADDAQD